MLRILLIEDQRDIAANIWDYLEFRGFVMDHAADGANGLRMALEGSYDVIVLDLGLPDGDGLSLLREWRKSGFVEPVLILSARDTVDDRIAGLDHGADDYLQKPFSFEELLARVRALIRRQGAVKQTMLEHRGIQLDLLSHTVRINADAVELTSREFALLEIFMHNPGRTLTRTLISEKIWASHYDIDTNLLDVYMSRLRAKLEPGFDKPLFKTVRGVGYQLV